MKYKTLIIILLFACFIFFLTVILGIKYNWGGYFSHKPVVASLPESQKIMNETAEPSSEQAMPQQQFELVNDPDVGETSTEEEVRNDCIRASRRAGVSDAQIHAVVNQCIELSLKADEQSQEAPDDKNSKESLTKKACEIVADAEKGISAEERDRIVLQCIEANTRE